MTDEIPPPVVSPQEHAERVGVTLPPDGAAVVCFTKCWPCLLNAHVEPPRVHPWADDEDIEHARKTGQPEPVEPCGCWCSRGSA